MIANALLPVVITEAVHVTLTSTSGKHLHTAQRHRLPAPGKSVTAFAAATQARLPKKEDKKRQSGGFDASDI
jgi:hypothetical protein